MPFNVPPNTAVPSLQKLSYAATRLGVTYARAADLARQGIIPVVRVGRQVRVSPEALEAWIATGGTALEGGWRRCAR